MALPISNPYAATYRTIGYRIRPGNPTEPIVADEEFSTIDCKTVTKVGFGTIPMILKLRLLRLLWLLVE